MRLRGLVFDGALLPGEFIDEKALAAAWQVSRTPLREALKVLAAEGLVELVPHRGCRVIELTEDDADALFPVMALLEGRRAFEAARKAGDDDLRTLQHLHEALERHAAAEDIEGYYRANHAFHGAVQSLADNRWLDRVTGDLRRFMRLMRGRQLALPGRRGGVDQRAPRADGRLRAARRRACRAGDARPPDGAAHGAEEAAPHGRARRGDRPRRPARAPTPRHPRQRTAPRSMTSATPPPGSAWHAPCGA
jgi:DNA-binding GntR family transcriptional regulator